MRLLPSRSVRPDGGSRRGRAGLGRWAVGLVAACSCGLGISLPSPATAVGNDPAAPGLPDVVGQTRYQYFIPEVLVRGQPLIESQENPTSLVAAITESQTDAPKAKLALKFPDAVVGVYLDVITKNSLQYDKRGKPFARSEATDFLPRIFFRDPGSVNSGWGSFPTVHVSTLAFGILPVSLDLRLTQLRENISAAAPQGTPVPLMGNIYQGVTYSPGQNAGDNVYYDVTVGGKVALNVANLRIDGRSIDIGSRCSTSSPVGLSLVGKQFSSTAQPVAEYYSAYFGGDLYGKVSIPSFGGCRSSAGDDVSAVLTSALSGDDTSIHINQGSTSQSTISCVAVFVACQKPQSLPQPTGPNQVPSQPPNYTPKPPPAPLPRLPAP